MHVLFGDKIPVASAFYKDMQEDMPFASERLLPVGIYGDFVPQSKEDSKNLDTMAQNIKDRFGLNSI